MISVDTKYKELIGLFAQPGQIWSLAAPSVYMHDFPGDALGRAVPYGIYEGLGRFARSAAAANDARWKRYAGKAPLAARDKNARAPSLAEPPTLILRLRAGFGVNAKADVLAFLLSIGGDRATIQDIERSTGYASVTVRDATRDMALARFIRETRTHPVSYYVRPKPWAELLERDGPGKHHDQEPVLPRWRFWAPVFAFLAHVDDLAPIPFK